MDSSVFLGPNNIGNGREGLFTYTYIHNLDSGACSIVEMVKNVNDNSVHNLKPPIQSPEILGLQAMSPVVCVLQVRLEESGGHTFGLTFMHAQQIRHKISTAERHNALKECNWAHGILKVDFELSSAYRDVVMSLSTGMSVGDTSKYRLLENAARERRSLKFYIFLLEQI